MIRPPRSRAPKKLLIAAAAAAALALIAAVALPILVDVDTYRGIIQRKAEEALGRKVALGPMRLSILPSVAIRIERPEVEGLLRAESLAVGVRLLPLLFSRAIDVRRVVLERPEVSLTRGADGSWEIPGAAAPAPPPAEAAQGPPAEARSFSLAKLVVRKAVVTLRDARRGGAPDPLAVTLDLEGSIRGSTAGDLAAALDGKLGADGLAIDLRGEMEKRGGAIDLDVVVDRARIDPALLRRHAAAWGLAWPLPEGLLRSPSLELGGRLTAAIEDGALSSLAATDVVVRGADVMLARDRKGRWNFGALAGEAGAPGGGTGEVRPSLTVKNLRLADSRVALRDEAAGGRPVELALEEVRLVVQELAPDRPVTIELEGSVTPGRGTLRASGALPPVTGAARRAPIDAELSLETIDVAAVRPYLSGALGIEPEAGRASARATLKGDYPATVAAAGQLVLDEVRLAGSSETISGTLSFALTAADGGSQVRFETLEAAVGKSRLGLRGSLDTRGGRKLADLEVPAASLDVSDLARMLRLSGAAVPVELSAGRPVTIQGRVKGDLGRPRELDLSGRLEVADLTFRHETMARPMEQVRGALTFKRDGFEVTGFSGVIGSSDVGGSLAAERLDAPRVTFALTSRRADFWELMSFMKEEAAGGPAGGGAPRAAGGDDYLAKVAARGTLQIGEGTFGEVAFSGLRSTLSLEGRTLRLDPVTMTLYGGSMSGSAALDLRPEAPICTIAANASGIDADPLLTAGAGLAGMLGGKLSADLSVTASGSDQASVIRSARGGGTIRVKNGRVGALNVLKVLSRATDVMGERSLHAVSGRLSAEGTDFSELSARLKLAGGRLRAESFSLVTPDMELIDDGALDMLASTIEVKGQIVFSEGLSQAMVNERSKAADYFWDSRRGRVNLPLTMAGPVAAPKPNIDWSTAGRQLARRRAEESVRDRLKEAGLSDLLGGRGGKLPAHQGEGGAAPLAPPSATGPTGGAAAGQPGRSGGDEGAAEGRLQIAVEAIDRTGNFLLPDLKVKGTLRGTDVRDAVLRVADEEGRILREEPLGGTITRYYATHDRAAPASIPFRVTVDGKRLAGRRRGLSVTITATDATGTESTRTFPVER